MNNSTNDYDLMIMKRFGNNLKRLLDDAWMTQKELADDTGISESTISRYINGSCMPSYVNVMKIAESLDCTLDELS